MARGADELRTKLVGSSTGARQWAAGARSERATGRLLEALEPARMRDGVILRSEACLVSSRAAPRSPALLEAEAQIRQRLAG